MVDGLQRKSRRKGGRMERSRKRRRKRVEERAEEQRRERGENRREKGDGLARRLDDDIVAVAMVPSFSWAVIAIFI